MSKIRDIIKAATLGPWVAVPVDVHMVISDHAGSFKVLTPFAIGLDGDDNNAIANADFIATFNPEHIALMEKALLAAHSLWHTRPYKCEPVEELITYRKERGLND